MYISVKRISCVFLEEDIMYISVKSVYYVYLRRGYNVNFWQEDIMCIS
jgi:hypothetical protein